MLTCDYHVLGAEQRISNHENFARPFSVVADVRRVYHDATLVADCILGFA